MLQLRMLSTRDGSLNGRDTRTYQAGETYELPDQGEGGLAEVFLREGWAERAEPGWEQPLELQRFALTLDAAPGVAEELRALAASTLEVDTLTPHRCQAITGRGTQCERDAVEDSDYCGLPAHAKQSL